MTITKRPYIHFKGKLYYVHDLVEHTESQETLVSYQALYPPYKMYVRPLQMFEEKVEPGRPDNITNQEYRFELYTEQQVVKAKEVNIMSTEGGLRYPKGSFIKWCHEYLKVVENHSDHTGTVMDMGGDITHNFYFNYSGDKAELITDENKIKELSTFVKDFEKDMEVKLTCGDCKSFWQNDDTGNECPGQAEVCHEFIKYKHSN